MRVLAGTEGALQVVVKSKILGALLLAVAGCSGAQDPEGDVVDGEESVGAASSAIEATTSGLSAAREPDESFERVLERNAFKFAAKGAGATVVASKVPFAKADFSVVPDWERRLS